MAMKPGTGHGVVLLHGLTGVPSEMRPLQRHLERLGYDVEVPLLPGHGTTHQALLKSRWRDWVAGARRTVNEVAARCSTVTVGGLSMGALLASLIAADDARVRGIMLLSPTLQYDGPGIPWTRRLLPLAHVVPFAGRLFYWEERPPYGLKDERLQRLVQRSVEAAKRGESEQFGLFRTYVGSILELNRLVKAVRQRAAAVRCPALILHSREDTVTTGQNAEDMLAMLGSPQKSIHWLTGCDHVITLDLKKNEVAREVGDFVARVSQATARAPELDEARRVAARV